MRALANLTLGGPGRVAITAAGIVSTAFVLDGHGDALLRAAFVTAVWGSAFLLSFMALALIASAMGIDVEGAVTKAVPKKADIGRSE